MKGKMGIPRGLALVYAGFISLFAMDVFGEGYGIGELMVALGMHLVPTGIVLAMLLVAWKKPVWGGVGFGVLGVVSVVFFQTWKDLVVLMLISMPLAVIGAAFVATGKTMGSPRAQSQTGTRRSKRT